MFIIVFHPINLYFWPFGSFPSNIICCEHVASDKLRIELTLSEN